VIDEGHVSGTIATSLTPFAKLLSVERRIIVTGTPTTNLLGLSFGKNDSEMVLDDLYGSPDIMQAVNESASELDRAVTSLVSRRWTKDDREDLRKLATMMIHFLGVPHFAADVELFDSHVMAPLFHADGPSPGAIRVLEQVMNMVMIRHQ
jgi:hypothetical protein